MGLLYEKERRAVAEKEMPDVKEADSLKRAAGKSALARDEVLEEDWDAMNALVEGDLAEEELDAEEIDDEGF